jgi:outer membrane protein assembly factor BamB
MKSVFAVVTRPHDRTSNPCEIASLLRIMSRLATVTDLLVPDTQGRYSESETALNRKHAIRSRERNGSMQRSLAILAAVVLAVVSFARGEDWPAFRGVNGDGVSSETNVPLHWGPGQNIHWKASLPAPGNSSPIVSKGRIFLTCATDAGKRRGLYCYDRHDGRLLWSQIVAYDRADPTHRTNPYCGSSPAADGTRVVVWHGSAGLHCSRR